MRLESVEKQTREVEMMRPIFYSEAQSKLFFNGMMTNDRMNLVCRTQLQELRVQIKEAFTMK